MTEQNLPSPSNQTRLSPAPTQNHPTKYGCHWAWKNHRSQPESHRPARTRRARPDPVLPCLSPACGFRHGATSSFSPLSLCVPSSAAAAPSSVRDPKRAAFPH
ncbi:hypothetical protein V2G26_009669 [Clonostachys chloroleuca]